jgi:calcineurin-like phosphoesterase family protein
MLSLPFFVISDTHFFHENIVKFCGRDGQILKLLGPKPDTKLIDHNEYMVKQWNSVVGPEDVILHLGDVFMSYRSSDARYMAEIMPRLNGKKYLIMGNHDSSRIDYSALGYEVIKPFEMEYRGWKVSFDHYPMDPGVLGPKGTHLRVHGHIHNNGYPKVKGEHGYRYGVTDSSTHHINVSVEVIDYAPQRITKLLDEAIDA